MAPDIVTELVTSFDDIAEALRWCIAHDTEPRRAHRLCAVLWAIVHQGHADDSPTFRAARSSAGPPTDRSRQYRWRPCTRRPST